MLYVKEALNTINASWLTLLLVRLFGYRATAQESGRLIRLARWRGKTYMLDVIDVDYI